MSEDNSCNLPYFEGESMRGLFETMASWQEMHGKRLLSTHIQQDAGKFCCIALSNPMEVVIADGIGSSQATVRSGRLWTT